MGFSAPPESKLTQRGEVLRCSCQHRPSQHSPAQPNPEALPPQQTAPPLPASILTLYHYHPLLPHLPSPLTTLTLPPTLTPTPTYLPHHHLLLNSSLNLPPRSPALCSREFGRLQQRSALTHRIHFDSPSSLLVLLTARLRPLHCTDTAGTSRRRCRRRLALTLFALPGLVMSFLADAEC